MANVFWYVCYSTVLKRITTFLISTQSEVGLRATSVQGTSTGDEDVEAMIEKHSSLKKDAQKKHSNGQKLLDGFREERKHRIQEIKQV